MRVLHALASREFSSRRCLSARELLDTLMSPEVVNIRQRQGADDAAVAEAGEADRSSSLILGTRALAQVRVPVRLLFATLMLPPPRGFGVLQGGMVDDKFTGWWESLACLVHMCVAASISASLPSAFIGLTCATVLVGIYPTFVVNQWPFKEGVTLAVDVASRSIILACLLGEFMHLCHLNTQADDMGH